MTTGSKQPKADRPSPQSAVMPCVADAVLRNETPAPEAISTRKPYSNPELTIYGRAEELTRMNGTKGGPDGGKFPRARSSL